MGFNNFEHQILKKIKQSHLDQRLLLLTISGGLDSMVLLEVFCQLRLQKNIKVLHFHHGDFENKKYRDDVSFLVQNVCAEKKICCVLKKSVADLKSESEFRAARQSFFLEHKTSETIYVTGHHLDDLFETRLIKMIRGTGVEGLTSFREYNSETFRPFLQFSKQDLLDYATQKKVSWLEDPTNSESHYLRNWIRHKWLPDLDQKHQGGSRQLALSLDKLLQSLDKNSSDQDIFTVREAQVFFLRSRYFTLSSADQTQLLAKILRHFQVEGYTLGQINEIKKRLENPETQFKFNLAHLDWQIEFDQISIF